MRFAELSSRSFGKAKEFFNAVKYFLSLQCFFALIMIGFSLKGGVALGVLMAGPALFAFFSGARKGSIFLLYYIAACFVIGQRSIYIGAYIRFVPSDVLMLGLAVMALINKPRFSIPNSARIPLFVWVLSAFSLLAVFMRPDWYPENAALAYAKMMWMAIPAYMLVRRVSQRYENYQSFFTIVAFGCFFLGFLALAEYLNLGFIHYFTGFLDTKSSTGYEGFRRLGGRFWGGPMLAGYLAMFFPMIITQINVSRTFIQKVILTAALVLSFFTIYFSGHRGIWIALMVAIGFFYYLKGFKGVLILVLIVVIGYTAMPEGAKTRFETLFGNKKDSSAIKRGHRAHDAWEMIKTDPIIGHGWGASGLVHSDLLQIWADAGAGSFGSFMLLLFINLHRLYGTLRKLKNKIYKEYAYGLFASLICSLVILANQAWLNLPEQYAPFWMLMALAYFFPAVLIIESKVQSNAQSEALQSISLKSQGEQNA